MNNLLSFNRLCLSLTITLLLTTCFVANDLHIIACFVGLLLRGKHLVNELQLDINGLRDVVHALEVNSWVNKEEPIVASNLLR